MAKTEVGYLFHYSPRPPSPKARAEALRRNLKRALIGLGITLVAVGLWLLSARVPVLSRGLSKPVSLVFGCVGVFLLLWGGLAGPWSWFLRKSTFIGLTRRKELAMRSMHGGVLWTYRVPLSTVQELRQVRPQGRDQGWYFLARNGYVIARFNPDLWSRRYQKTMLATFAEHAPRVKITTE